ncbi:sensor histidine kinase [Dactylosporangium sp. NPDC051541]|uniref:sensor histidine kinase n=1 Tax=Dactylosporangium sp. NPDC051541 TaxID=3363977 RepID=UPI003788BE15
MRLARAAVAVLAVLGTAAFAASIGPAYRRIRAFDPGFVWRADAVPAGLAELGIPVAVAASVRVVVLVLVAAAFVGAGVLVVVRRPEEPVAVLFAAVLIAFGVHWPNTLPVPGWPAPLTAAAQGVGLAGLLGFLGLLFLFPDGRFTPGWTRWALLAVAAYVGVGELTATAGVLDLVAVLVWVGAGSWSQVRRYRTVSTPVQRQQVKWVAAALVVAAGGLTVVAFVRPLFTGSPAAAVAYNGLQLLVFGGVFGLVPLAIGRAVLRYRLWDIDPILNRAFVLGGLTIALSAVYAAVVVGVSRAAGRAFEGVPVASFAAAGVVAVLFEPVRRRLQRWANRLTYGERDDPYTAVTALARRLQDTAAAQAVLPTLVRSVREAVRSPYAAVAGPDGSVLAADGDAGDGPPARRDLTQRGEPVGTLLVAPRGPGERFDARDDRLLDDLARQAATAMHAVRLAGEVQASRERLVLAHEEERRRLRRDLHDGLGPTLAAQAMRVEAARDLVRRRPDAAVALLDEVLISCTDAVAEVRRVSRGLRPPALDELGLCEAVRQAAAVLGAEVVADPGALPPLPAAVEVAAYAIVREALTNAARHAAAASVVVRLTVSASALRVEVRDDGRGLRAGERPGVGLRSMIERAAELGGRCTVTAGAGGGTRVSATLPLAAEPPADV